MSNLTIAIVRTVVPFIYSFLITWGIQVDEAELAGLLTTVIGGGLHAVISTVERRFPAAGWLLGKAKAPAYDT